MSTVQTGDQIAVYRGSKLYHAPADMSTLQDTDIIVVGRGTKPYKCTFLDWKNSQTDPPAIGGVTLADSPEAGRFTSGTFATTVTGYDAGDPAATVGLKAWVEGTLKSKLLSDEIVAVNTLTGPKFSDNANISVTDVGHWNSKESSFDGDPTTSATSGSNVSAGQQSVMKFTYPGGPVAATKLEIMHPMINAYPAGSLTYSVNGGAFKPLTGANNTWIDVTADAGGTFSSIALKYVGQAGYLMVLIWLSQMRLNGQVLRDNASHTTLTFNTDKDLASFAGGDAVNQNDSAASGTVGSVDVTAKTMTLATSTGTWGPANTGKTVVGPSKPASNVKLYCKLDAAGAVSDLQSADPGYVTMTGNSPYTLTWPATLPSGNPPDTDLPAGTTITTEVQATNTAGTVKKTSNTVTPA